MLISQFAICTCSESFGFDWEWGTLYPLQDKADVGRVLADGGGGETFNHGGLGSIHTTQSWRHVWKSQWRNYKSLACNSFTQVTQWKHQGQSRKNEEEERFWMLNMVLGRKRSTLTFAPNWEKYIIFHEMKTNSLF